MLVLKPGEGVCTGETSPFSIYSLALLVQSRACSQPLLQRCHRESKEIGLVANGANTECMTLFSQDKSSLLLLCFLLNGRKTLVGFLINLLYVRSFDSG